MYRRDQNDTSVNSRVRDGYDLLIDFGVDACVAGKYAWVSEITQGVTVSAKGISDSMPIEDNLPIVNMVYAYDNLKTGE